VDMQNVETRGTAVTVIGLGAMGFTLASTLLERGYTVTVWNRSADRAAGLVAKGAVLAPSAAQAIAASPLTIMCVVDFSAANLILTTPAVESAIRGRSLVQLTTGEGSQAREQAKWARSCGALYLTGGPQAWPRDIGKADTLFLYAGDRECFDRHAEPLAALAGDRRYLGADAAIARVVSLALGSVFVGGELGFFEGAAVAVAAGSSIEEFSSLALRMLDLLANCIRDASRRIKEGNYSGEQASIDIYAAGKQAVQGVYASSGVQSKIRDAYYGYLQQAQSAGKGSLDIAALFCVISAPAK
jgi:3-hydroxyisobutyrate dehydrogenase-like beta-hydroxyacid dehydrogenase